MTPGTIECVLRIMRHHDVRALLSGGQACIFYGAAEFSKDVDFVVLADAENFQRLKAAARELECEVIAVPPFEKEHLDAAGRFSDEANSVSAERPLVDFALRNDPDALRRALVEEMEAEKGRDRIYWEPLKARLMELRRERRRS